MGCIAPRGIDGAGQDAGTLKISPATVKNHVHTILEKLNVSRRNAIGGSLSFSRRLDHRRTSSLLGPEPESRTCQRRPNGIWRAWRNRFSKPQVL